MKNFQKPNQITVTGTVATVNTKKAAEYASLKRDSIVVDIISLSGDKTTTFWVSANTFNEYDLSKVLFVNNVVSVTLDECVAGITGYELDGIELAHAEDFLAFSNAVNTPAVILAKEGLPEWLIRDLMTKQATIAATVPTVDRGFHFGQKELDAEGLVARYEEATPKGKLQIASRLADMGLDVTGKKLKATVAQ